MNLQDIADLLDNAHRNGTGYIMITEESAEAMSKCLKTYNDMGTLYYKVNGIKLTKKVTR